MKTQKNKKEINRALKRAPTSLQGRKRVAWASALVSKAQHQREIFSDVFYESAGA